VEEVALRTMMKAVYSTRNAGHFGLAFNQYTHFTSPIRRHPDLTVHRLLKVYSEQKPETAALAAKLSDTCEIATEREITAQEAERESIKAKQVEYMEGRLEEEFDGIISGVVSFGFFVEIPEYLVEGLVHISDLDDDYYIHDESHYRLIGQTKEHVYRLGDPVRVRLVRVLREMRKIDFVLVRDET
jgi:ribonuclease R